VIKMNSKTYQLSACASGCAFHSTVGGVCGICGGALTEPETLTREQVLDAMRRGVEYEQNKRRVIAYVLGSHDEPTDPSHTCHTGPLCAYWHSSHSHADDPGNCIHESCCEIIHEFCGECYVETMQDVDDGIVECPAHGRVMIVASDTFTGYAGGRCYASTLSCGCSDVDESADLRAAY
jgi:hypothetical protein